MRAGIEQVRLGAVVERARRRILVNRALWEAGLAFTIALLGPTLFLLLGRDWFGWPMLVVFALAGIGVAVWRVWRRQPDHYRVSQVLDARLSSEDQISTAIYFAASQAPAAVEQRQAAAQIAERADLETVFPLVLPRSLYGLASVFLVASALCALRYFLEKPLRVDRPLPQVILQALREDGGPNDSRRARQQARNAPPKQDQALAIESDSLGKDGNPQQGQETSDPAANAQPQAGDQARTPESEKAQTQGLDTGDPFGDPMPSDGGSDAVQSYEDMLERDAKSGLAKAQGQQGKDSNGNENKDGAGSADSNSLLAKLRDAMNNMLSRMQQKPQGNGQQQASNGNQGNGEEQQDGKGQGKSGAGQPTPGGKETTEGEGSESDSQDMSAQNSAGQSNGKTSDQSARGQSGSGAGRQEGDKQIADAQQQAALGKLSELYGKRAANVTGEVTVETQSGKQTLKTPQTEKQARHGDPGGEVSRDEIPLAYQAYVKEYFNKLHQSAKK